MQVYFLIEKQPPEVFSKKSFSKFRHLCHSLFFNKEALAHFFYRTRPVAASIDCFFSVCNPVDTIDGSNSSLGKTSVVTKL